LCESLCLAGSAALRAGFVGRPKSCGKSSTLTTRSRSIVAPLQQRECSAASIRPASRACIRPAAARLQRALLLRGAHARLDRLGGEGGGQRQFDDADRIVFVAGTYMPAVRRSRVADGSISSCATSPPRRSDGTT
jgi:hypothetical protein